MTKYYFGWGSAPDYAGGDYSAHPEPLAGMGPTFKWGGRDVREKYARYAHVPMPAQQNSSVPDGPLHISIRRCLSSTTTFCQ